MHHGHLRLRRTRSYQTSTSKITPSNSLTRSTSLSPDPDTKPLVSKPNYNITCYGIRPGFLSFLRSLFGFFSLLPHRRPLGRNVTGTLFGRRRGLVSFTVQEDPASEPMLIVELGLSTGTLVREMSSGLVRIALECNKPPTTATCSGSAAAHGGPVAVRGFPVTAYGGLIAKPGGPAAMGGGPMELRHGGQAEAYGFPVARCGVISTLGGEMMAHGGVGVAADEPRWKMYCNGRKCGQATSRRCEGMDRHVLGTLRSVSVGAGMIPVVAEEALLYMRARFERVVGGQDSEAFYMLNPDGNGPSELSIFFMHI